METGNTKHYLRPQGKGIKLHLGCGDYWYENYINIDINIYGGTDMLWDLRKGLPFQPEVVEIIEAYEVFEHFSPNEAYELLEDWKRVLIPDGVIKISVPNMDKLIELYGQNKDKSIQEIYGFEQCQNHKWGYTKETLKALFEQHGYKDVVVEEGELPNRPGEDKLILSCKK